MPYLNPLRLCRHPRDSCIWFSLADYSICTRQRE